MYLIAQPQNRCPHLVGAQLFRLSPVDTHDVALKETISHVKIVKHYSAFCM